jgi:predicted PurR-regulated permease PerM
MNDSNKSLNNQRFDLHVPISTILKILLVVVGAWFLFQVRNILFLLFIALFIAALVNNGVVYLQKYIKYRTIAVVLLYSLFIITVLLILVVLIPLLINQISDLHRYWPDYSARLISLFPDNWQTSVSEMIALNNIDWQASVGGVLLTIKGFFGGMFNLMIVFALSFYMCLEQNAWNRALGYLLPNRYADQVRSIYSKVENQLSQWFQAQLVLCLFMAVLAYIGLTILGVKYALLLSILVFVGEIVPYLGPIFYSILAVAFAFLQSPLTALIVFAWFVLINQIENHILVPNIMRRAIGLNPIITITALLVGVRLAGIAGALLAIPTATMIRVVLEHYQNPSHN